MTTPEIPANNPPPESVAVPDAAGTINTQPVVANAPHAQPDTVATASNTSQTNPPQAGGIESAARFKDPNWRRRLRPQQPLVGVPRAEPIAAEPRMVEPRVGEHDLLVECSLKLTTRTGTVIDFPLKTILSSSLAPAFLPLVHTQFELVLNELLVKPVTIAFISHLEDVKAMRKTNTGKAKEALAVEQEKAEDAARGILNRKCSPL